MCASLLVDRDWLEETVLKIIRTRLSRGEGWDALEAGVRDRLRARKAKYGGDSDAAQRKLADIEGKIANYYVAIGQALDPLVCQQHIAELTAKKAEVEHDAELLAQEDYYQLGIEKNLAAQQRFAAAFDAGFEKLPFGAQRAVVLKRRAHRGGRPRGRPHSLPGPIRRPGGRTPG